MHELWSQRCERFENERALRKARMRHDEPGFVHDLIAVEQHVEVERARGVAHAAFAAGVALDRATRSDEAIDSGAPVARVKAAE